MPAAPTTKRNYIHTLQDDRYRLQCEVADLENRIRSLHIYLSSSKFSGVDYRDGSSNSRVEVADVLHRLGLR